MSARDKRVMVTCTDHASGESDTKELKPDDYVLIVGERMQLAGVQKYGNGTTVLTIKRKPPVWSRSNQEARREFESRMP